MLAQVRLSGLAAPCATPARRPRAVAVRAEEKDANTTTSEGGPKFSFEMNKLAGVGYQSEDSAGQQNIFAVEPKQYVAQDNTVGGGSLVGVGSLIALALLGGGLTALINTDGGAAEDMSGYKTATEYAQAFRAAGSAPSTQI